MINFQALLDKAIFYAFVSSQLILAAGGNNPRTARTFNYFAYGSNMNSNILAGRGITGQIIGPAILTNYRLAFNVIGVPFVEPTFASVEESKLHSVHGALITIDSEDYLKLCLTEAVPVYYVPKEIVVELYTGETVNGFTLQAANGPFRLPYLLELPPSNAYLNIIREGAREVKLKEEYCNFLESITPNQIALKSNWRSKIHRKR